ncbi:Integrin beta-1-binding protein 2 [Neolecta irregularis DAH-3]|uniref:Integrin beta-1-binding protein 2 n=1 Tax=Neolecta irregularis (strain DAH-3) TaxID=1198029 RepID=A0A1U7LP33_NEOID|nr:Integrin beta-1-binding protein 2 [Neolecta irregularis DAH-3]|eukprot:OLL24388.1 Integrin beta-1-binding protein 2 [Neolecta irregularis DAH-3]
MAVCTRKGCGKEFDPEKTREGGCTFHPGQPVFHEGLKGYTCCKKRVTSFEEFLELPGCSTGSHSLEQETRQSGPTTSTTAREKMVNRTEVSAAAKPASLSVKQIISEPPQAKPLDQDPADIPIQVGAKCKRTACNAEFVSDQISRGQDKCTFHPGQPIFHEGSKGYSCCKRKVLEFDEFLKIRGCTVDRHLFIGTLDGPSDNLTECRTDFYQTPGQVIVSIFAKKAESDKTEIKFSQTEIQVDVLFSGNQRYKSTIPLYDVSNPQDNTINKHLAN